MKGRTPSLTLLLLLGMSAAAGPLAADPPAAEKLPAEVRAIIEAARFRHASWGLHVVDLQTGEPLVSHRADALMTPASTTKLYSVACALDALGAQHRFKTPVYRRGHLEAGCLSGDLILVAQGDPTLGGRTDEKGRIAYTNADHTYADSQSSAELTAPDPLAGLDELARQVAAAGIKQVAGDVLVDDRLFEHAESTGSGPVRIAPILINDNLIDLVVTPTSPGKPATVDWRPKSKALAVDARVDTVAAKEETKIRVKEIDPTRLTIRGSIAADRAATVRVHEVRDPARHARALFIEALGRAGVQVTSSLFAENCTNELPPAGNLAGMERVAEFVSPPFSENARLILKVSHNQHASLLPLLVAVKNQKRTLAEGLRIQNGFLLRRGVPMDAVSFGGGAGGSRADLTSPKATVALLSAMSMREDFPVYLEALPILGVDGTLAKTVDSSSPAKGKVQAKTGTYTAYNVMGDRYVLTSKALAGYLTTAKNRRLAFCFLVNNIPIEKTSEKDQVGKTLGRLCEALHGLF